MRLSGCLLAVAAALGLLQGGCVRQEPPVRLPPTASEDILLSAVSSQRKRLSYRVPEPATSATRQDGVVGWFLSQLVPDQAPVAIPPLSPEQRQQIKHALEGRDVSFPLEMAAQVAPALQREEVLEAWINADLLQNDPHARYLPGPKAKDLDKMLRIYDQGTGLSVIEDPDSPGGIRVEAVSADSPAASVPGLVVDSGLLAWREEGGKWHEGATAQEWQAALSSDVGTRIWLRWRSPGHERTMEASMLRSWWSIADRRARGRLQRIDGVAVGIIKIPLFYHQTQDVNTSADLVAERNRLRAAGAQIIALDLRGNPGGYWQEAIASAGAFAPGAHVADALPGNGVVLPLSAPATKDPWTGPVWIWVDRQSASASEVLAGFLRLRSNACLVGERTSGKGSIQILSPLRDAFSGPTPEGQLVLTSMLYRWSDGTGPQYWGLEPDAWIHDPQMSLEFGERILPNAIRADFKKPSAPVSAMPWSGEDMDILQASLLSPACRRP